MKCSDFIALFLEESGVRCIFGYQGGSITHLIDSIAKRPLLKYIQNYNEQASSLCADAYARLSDERLGVAIASNGPGATNLITGIANAYCDSIPALFITGQVHSNMMKKNHNLRQESFQEVDIISMVKNITKYCITIKNIKSIKYELEKAIFIAQEGRPGPVLIDIPVDIQGMDLVVEDLESFNKKHSIMNINIDKELDLLIENLKKSKKPLILAGGGINSSNSVNEFREVVKKIKVPVVTSLQGLDVLNHFDEYFCGFIGSYGNRYSNLALQNADFILIIGSRLDMRQIGKHKEYFAPFAYKVHIEIDEFEINHSIKEDINIICHIKDFLKLFLSKLQNENLKSWYKWIETVKIWERRFNNINNLEFEPNRLISGISNKIDGKVVISSDVGQNQMWIAQSLRINSNSFRIINSGGLGTMGYSLPACIAAYYTNNFDKHICFMGDGGLQMNIQELCLIGDKQLPIKIFILNNYSLGLIRQIHEKYYDKRYVGSVNDFSQPDFIYLSKAYKINYYEIEKLNDINNNFEILLNDNKPYIINCKLSFFTNLTPELLGNDNLDNQYPYLTDREKKLIKKELNFIAKNIK